MREKCQFCDGEGYTIDTDVEYKRVDGRDELKEVQIQIKVLCQNCNGMGYVEEE